MGVLYDDTEVRDGNVTLSGGNGYGLFVNIVLGFGERAIGQCFGGNCYFGHASG